MTINKIPETVTFEAEVNKLNVPGKWTHNGEKIFADKTHEIFAKGVIHRLTITKADGRSEGTYKLEVKDISSQAKLEVNGE